jgi:Protein of unknown function (DUF1203)
MVVNVEIAAPQTLRALRWNSREFDSKGRGAAARANTHDDNLSDHGGSIMSFRIRGLPAEQFADLFSLSAEELAARGAMRRPAREKPGYPCRISLTDAEPGEEVILTHFEHHAVDTPFRSSYAIYVRAGETTYDAVDQVPEQLRSRLLSVRAFDKAGMLINADVVDGRELEDAIERLLADAHADYLHVHFAKPGCYAARVERA